MHNVPFRTIQFSFHTQEANWSGQRRETWIVAMIRWDSLVMEIH